MIRPLLFFLFVGCSANVIFGQSKTVFINGRIVDQETGEPIPYVNISIDLSSEGTAADEQGRFLLPISASNLGGRIQVSCIGYQTMRLPIDSLLIAGNDRKELTLLLRSYAPILDAVVVAAAPINPFEVVQEALNHLDKNYYQRPFNLDLYSMIEANDSIAGKFYRVETMLEGYYEGYSANSRRKFEIIHKRTRGENPLEAVGYNYWPSFEIGAADLLSDPNQRGIFNLEFKDEITFTYEGLDIYDSDTVFHISYNIPKPNKKNTGYGIVPSFYEGDVFISEGNFAVVRHAIRTSSFKYEVIYKKYRDYYFPYYLSGERLNDFKLPGGKRQFKTTNSIRVANIRLADVRVIPADANEFHVDRVPYDRQFWDTFFPMPGEN